VFDENQRSPSDQREVQLQRQHLNDLFRYETEATTEIMQLQQSMPESDPEMRIANEGKCSACVAFRTDVRIWIRKLVGVTHTHTLSLSVLLLLLLLLCAHRLVLVELSCTNRLAFCCAVPVLVIYDSF
jgi:hypothetical protein